MSLKRCSMAADVAGETLEGGPCCAGGAACALPGHMPIAAPTASLAGEATCGEPTCGDMGLPCGLGNIVAAELSAEAALGLTWGELRADDAAREHSEANAVGSHAKQEASSWRAAGWLCAQTGGPLGTRCVLASGASVA
jgi:hypothetical protein